MNLQIFQDNLDLVYFFYGLAFIILGLAVYFQTNKASELRIARLLWLLSSFGIIHGCHEWLSMWQLIRGEKDGPVLLVTNLLSFALLFEFGRRLFNISFRTQRAGKLLSRYILNGGLIVVIAAGICIAGILSPDFLLTGTTLTRYFIALPACSLTGIALFHYYRHDAVILLRLKRYFIAAGTAFLVYGIFAGLIVKKSAIFPSTYINEDAFLSLFVLPVPIFRALCAVVITVSISRIVKIFDLEKRADRMRIVEDLRDKNDELHRLTGELRDKTLQLETSNAKLQELDRLKSEFLQVASHELKTPLSSIMGFAETLKTLELPKEDTQRYLGIIASEARRLAKLLSEYLDISMIEAGIIPMPKAEADIPSIIREVVEFFPIPDGISIVMDFPGIMARTMVNRDKIKQVIINLLDNAIKYSPKKGKITLTAKEHPDHLVVCIQDEGLGIPPGDLGRLYNKFYRSGEGQSRGIKGFGLGLAIAKSIVEAHQGKIWVESESDRGSSFYFSLAKM
jgi:signal transduction histidine kinase